MWAGEGIESIIACRDSLLGEAMAASDLVLCMCVIMIRFSPS
jgi:hypothetical protein